ncbi:MAG: lipopolysaccharide biosynthesis protein [Alphaproteobacteria bacterium]
MALSFHNRIILNIVASYGRSLFALVCGLFTGRWTLMILGETDYGLYNVIGGLTVFISFFNTLLAGALSRFYAFSIGEAQKPGNEESGLEQCREWFNTALSIHTVVPLVLMLIGYPIGEWLIRNWLTIPVERISDCLFIFKVACVTCFISMISVPFQAMYTAKQYIAEVTLFGLVASLFSIGSLYWMLTHSRDWLRVYALVMNGIFLVPNIYFTFRALSLFPECKFNLRYMWDKNRILQIVKFVGWQFFGNLGYMFRTQGMSIMVNKMFGLEMNTVMALGGAVTSKTNQLQAAFNGAIMPALTTIAGTGEDEKMLRMTYRTCRLSLVLLLVFVIPVSLELHELLILWLKNPPALLESFTQLMFVNLFLETSNGAVGVAVTANGRIAAYYFILGSINIISLPLVWLFVWLGWCGFLSSFAILVAIRLIAVLLSTVIARQVMRFSPMIWLKEVMFPVIAAGGLAFLAGFLVKQSMQPTIWRILIVSATSFCIFSCLSLAFVLRKEERDFVLAKIRKALGREV